MSKLSFRARALDVGKPMPILMAEELPDLPDYSAINRAVPQMPSGMEKEEESEHHLQRAICTGLIIPTPEVVDMPNKEFYNKVYPADYIKPRQFIHMQPFTMEPDIPDYDMDSEDERWLQSQTHKLELSPLKFEEMMDRLEKNCGQTGVSVTEAKGFMKEDDDLIIAVFDYWLNKRLTTQHPLILNVKTEHRPGIAVNNPYLAFRRRTEKMQTRKNRKNDETSYEKMLKLRRDLTRAVTLLELVKKREKLKREHVHLSIEIFEKRYQAKDFNGAIYAEASIIRTTRPAFTPIFHNHCSNQGWPNKAILKDEVIPRKEKRQYKKRKHKSLGHIGSGLKRSGNGLEFGLPSSDDETMVPSTQLSPEPEEVEDEGQFAFRRNKLCSYHMPLPKEGNWPWCSKEENGMADKRYRFTLTSLSNPKRCIGFARRRIGRGGRIILDRISTDYDDLWRTLDFSIIEPNRKSITNNDDNKVKIDNLCSTQSSKDSLIKMDSSFNINNNVNLNNNKLRTDIKTEFNNFDNNNSRTMNISELISGSVSDKQIKQELLDEYELLSSVDNNVNNNNKEKEDVNEMIEFLQTVRKDWLHFRPKTPPPNYEPPCHLLPADDNYIMSCANTSSSFSMEIQSLDAPSTLLDTSTFITDPFIFENLDTTIDVPVTDTRQQPQQQTGDNKIVQTTGINLNINVGLNTLNSSVNNDNNSVISNVNLNDNIKLSETLDLTTTNIDSDYRTIGCSRFYVSDLNSTTNSSNNNFNNNTVSKLNIVSSTLTSSKFNSVNAVSDGRPRVITSDSSVNNSNGLLPQFGYDVSTNRIQKNNKISYAYPGGMVYSNASPSTLSLHTSAHTLTLNSHSANILEIPMANETETVVHTTKLVNSTETGGTTTNNKTKTIVRKNNLVMEVT